MTTDSQLINYTVRNIEVGDEEDVRVLELAEEDFHRFPPRVADQIRRLVADVGYETDHPNWNLWRTGQEKVRELLLPYITEAQLHEADPERWYQKVVFGMTDEEIADQDAAL